MCNDGIKSKERVAQFGEVYTPENIVKDMLDLVKDESYRIDSTFLEPACGNGNFLVEILSRKLETAEKLDKQDYDKNVFIAVSSIYAIDILEDNIQESKARMLEIVKTKYKNYTGNEIEVALIKSIVYILERNILWGDGLTGLSEEPDRYHLDMIITEWKVVDGQVHISEQTFNSLINQEDQVQLMLDLGLELDKPKEFVYDNIYVVGKDISLERIEELKVWCTRYIEVFGDAKEEEKEQEDVQEKKEEVKKPAPKKKSKAVVAW